MTRKYTYRSRDEANQIADHATTQCEHHGVAREALVQHPVLNCRLRLAVLAVFAGRDDVRQEPRFARVHACMVECSAHTVDYAELREVRIRDKHVCAGRQRRQERRGDMRHEVVAELNSCLQAPQLMNRRSAQR